MTTTNAVATIATCAQCASIKLVKPDKSGLSRLPRGWHRLAGGMLCEACWSDRFTMKAVSMRVLGPIDDKDREPFFQALRASWLVTTRLCNWLVVELRKADVVRMPDMVRLPKSPNPYLYPFCRKIAPELSPASIVAIDNRVRRCYNAKRYEMIWLGSVSLPTYSYPQPYPLPAQAWSASYHGQIPVISVTIGGVRFTLKLKGSFQFAPQLRSFKSLVDGQAVACELALSEHHDGGVMAKLVMWIPKQDKKAATQTMFITTDKQSLLIGSVDGVELWRFNADQAPRWVAEHNRRLMRLREDVKLEARTGEVSDPATHRASLVKKQHQRLDSLVHQASAAAVNRASRFACNKIVFSGRETSYAESFPWFALATHIEQKAKAANISFEYAQIKETEPDDKGQNGKALPTVPAQ